jgi:hypothetical protein
MLIEDEFSTELRDLSIFVPASGVIPSTDLFRSRPVIPEPP